MSGSGIDRSNGIASTNLVDRLRAALRAGNSRDGFTVTPLHDAGQSDLAVLVQQVDDLEGSAERISRTLAERPEIAAVRRARQRLLLRLDDAFVADLGAKLEAGETSALANDDLLPGVPYIVDFCDPNATKGLHVGHLRNVALGHALASVLEVAGARVSRQSVISDSGQQIGEAMAGYVRNGNGATPEDLGQKGDHFVGQWYAQYVSENDAGSSADVLSPDLPIARELAEQDDLATLLLQRLAENEDEIVEIWREIRDWVVAGQGETLTRLGVEFDQPIFESSYMPRMASLIESAVERGIFTYSPSGALVYETGREEYPTLPLARPDGFSTLNLRAILIWHELMPVIPEVKMLHVSGLEWKEHTIHAERILRSLRPELPVQPTHYVLHGMVTTDDGVVSSSTGDVLLIDDLLDELMTREELRSLSIDRPGCGAEDLAVIAALAFSLDRPLSKALCVTPDRVLDPATSTGSVFARVWSQVWDPASDGDPDPDPNDPVYRFAVVQSQFQRQILSRTIERLDPLDSIRHLARLSEWYLAAPSSPSTDRVMRSVLGEGFRGLGLIRTNSSGATLRPPATREAAARV